MELLEIQHDQIRDGEVPALRSACPHKIDAGHTVRNLESAVTGKPIVNGNPAIDESFRGTRTFEELV